MKNIYGKNGLTETWCQYEARHDVAMATVLAPVHFSFEPNITICIMRERRTSSKHNAELLSWRHYSMPYCVSFLRYITGAKFQLQFLKISRDILDFVICLVAVTIL